MELKIRKYSLGQPFLLLSIVLAMLVISVSVHFLVSGVVNGISTEPNELTRALSVNIWFEVIKPIYTVSILYLILKYVESKNPIVLSVLVAALVSILMFLTEFTFLYQMNFILFFKELVSIFILIIVWIILAQSDQINLINALSLGYFASLATLAVWRTMQGFIIHAEIGIFSMLFSICLAGIISSFFGFGIKVLFRLFRIQY